MLKRTSRLYLIVGIWSILCLAAGGQPKPLTQTEWDGVRATAIDARNTANDAKSAANTAQTAAQDAKSAADGATNTAKDAKSAANQAQQIASAALSKNVETKAFVDRFWVLLAAVLVFFMQAGFKCLEVGMSRRRQDAAVGVMNLMNWLVLCVFYYLIGFGLMFGHSWHGLLGIDWGPPASTGLFTIKEHLGIEFFLFQLAFAGTTATIVDGAIAERTSLLSYFFVALIVAIVIYPIFGHWVWNDYGWLHKIEFHDFAGSTVVHSVGAWISLVAVRVVGPRRFRFNEKTPESQKERFRPYSLGYSVLGVIMLWFGWWGFNGGSKLEYDTSIANIILHTNLAGASAGIIAYFHALWRDREHVYEKIIGGALGGLVAITASCDVVGPLQAIIIGAIAGVVHNWAYDYLLRKKIDDVAGAIPVHGACGVLGTLMAGVFIGLQDGRLIERVGVQLLGILAAFLFTSVVAGIFFLILEKTVGLRSSVAEEDADEEPRAWESEGARGYAGPLWVSVRRWAAWSRFMTWEEFLKQNRETEPWKEFVAKIRRLSPENRQEFEHELKDRWQFIRNNDTHADLEDIKLELRNLRKPIFINYRHNDASDYAGQIRAALEQRYRKFGDWVFMDGDLQNGVPVWNEIEGVMRNSMVFISVVGREWFNENNRSRLQDPNDLVRKEIALALERRAGGELKMITVLVDDARPLTDAMTFKITKKSLTRLAAEGAPEDLIGKLECILDIDFRDKEAFWKVVEELIEDEHAARYKALILGHTFDPELQDLVKRLGEVQPIVTGRSLTQRSLDELIKGIDEQLFDGDGRLSPGIRPFQAPPRWRRFLGVVFWNPWRVERQG